METLEYTIKLINYYNIGLLIFQIIYILISTNMYKYNYNY